MNTIIWVLIGTAISFSGTILGSAFVLFAKKGFNQKIQKLFLGFASGVMIAASVWSLLLPAAEYSKELNMPEWLPCVVGFIMGALFLFAMDKLLPHQHIQANSDEGLKIPLRKSTKLIFAVSLHNFPEGMAVGLAFALAGVSESPITLTASIVLAVGIAIQNIPEGAIISLPLRGEGFSKKKSFFYGILSGVVEPVAGVIGALIIGVTLKVIPWALAFAAGAMIYVVVDELIPDAASKHSDFGSIGAILGFAIMMFLDMMFG